MAKKTSIFVVIFTYVFLTSLFAQTGTWNTAVTPSAWETGSNWTGGIIANGSDNTANFNQVDITADTTVNLSAPRDIGHLSFDDTDTSSAGSWILSGGSNTLTLAGTSPTIFVDALGTSKAATINALLAGTSGFSKTGDGKLILNNSANSFSGVISISEGTLEYANAGSLGAGSLSFTGNSTLRAGAVTTVARAMNIASGINATYDTNGCNTSLSGALSGSGTLTKSGSGELKLTGGEANAFTGAIMINQGRLLSNDGFSFKNMTGQVTVASGAAFYFGQNFQSNPLNNLSNALNLSGGGDGTFGALHLDFNAVSTGAITLSGDVTVSHSYNNAKIDGPITGNDRNLTLDSRIAGQGALIINGNINLGTGTMIKSGLNRAEVRGVNTFGNVVVSTGALYFEDTSAFGVSGANIKVEDNGVAVLNGSDIQALIPKIHPDSTGMVAFEHSVTASNQSIDMSACPTLVFGAVANLAYSGTITTSGNYRFGGYGCTLTVSSPLAGLNGLVISNSSSGTVHLTGSLDYMGATVVKKGTLQMTAALSGGITVESSGTLRLSPNTATGTIATSQAFVSNGTLSLRIKRDETQNSDRITAASIALSGTITIVNEGAALEAGDSFQLLSTTGVITRSGMTLNLPALTTGLSWNLNNLYKTGVITVATIGSFTAEVGDPNHPQLLVSEINAVYSSGQPSVIINPGTYHFPDGFEYQSVITLNGWENFTIIAENVLFVVGKQRAFVLEECDNVKIKGLTIRARYASATQGRVLATGTNANGTTYAVWKISDGYPLFLKDSAYAPVANEFKAGFAINVVDGITGRINIAAGDTYGCIMTPQADNTWKVDFTGRSSLPIAVNDWLVTRIDGSLGQSHGVFLLNSINCTLESITSQSGGFATFYEDGGGGNRLVGCKIECSPVPPSGTTEPPVVSCAADGVHARKAYPGIHIDNLTTTGVLLDDCIAIHGFFRNVTQSSGNTITLSELGEIKVNDFVRISHHEGFFDQATCIGIQDLGLGGYLITLDKNLNVPIGSKVCNPKYDGDGFRILNCHLSGTRSRAIIAKADNGVISGCTFDDCGSAVRLGSDYWWNESGYGWNVMVENNTILNCSQGVDVHSDGARGNKNITISNNTIGAMTGYALNIEGCDGVMVSGNSFGAPVTAETVNFKDSSNVTLVNNLVAYAAGSKSILKGVANVTNLQGQNNGMLYSGRAYAITNSLSNLLLANPASNAAGGLVQQYSACNASGRWILQPDGTGYVKILSAANRLALGVNNTSIGGTPLVLESPGNGAGQLWTLKPVGTTTIELVNKLSGLSATVTNNTLGETVNQSTGASNTGQLWSTTFNDSTYATWRITSGASSDPMADDNQDGVSNLEEYALAPAASAPLTSAQTIPLTVNGQTDDYFTLSCNRRVSATDVMFTVVYSTDLITWQPTAVLVSSTPNPDGTTREVWRVPNMGATRGFLSVRTQLAN